MKGLYKNFFFSKSDGSLTLIDLLAAELVVQSVLVAPPSLGREKNYDFLKLAHMKHSEKKEAAMSKEEKCKMFGFSF